MGLAGNLMEQRLKDLLSDLGRRTLRGVKPCPKCGTYNGTRGFSCKNKSCDVVFKVAEDRKKKTTEACRVVTDNRSVQVYSVRLRDRGPDYRAFVQISTDLVDSGDGNLSATQNVQCFVEMCHAAFVAHAGISLGPTCQHVQATMNCYSESEILPVKWQLVHSLNIPVDIREELWSMAHENGSNDGSAVAAVQRVSKTIFVVKCIPSAKFPIGYLHSSFTEVRSKSGATERKFICPCRKVKNYTGADMTGKECSHFYACILAFISDEKLMNEFSYHIQASNVLSVSLDNVDDGTSSSCSSQRQLVVQFEVLSSTSAADSAGDLLCGDVRVLESLGLPSSTDEGDTNSPEYSDDASLTLPLSVNDLLTSGPVHQEQATGQHEMESKLLKERATRKSTNKNDLTKKCTETATSVGNGVGAQDETCTYILFENWLSSVTERINQTMHFQMSGRPEPLVYQIPHSFFDCLRERIYSGARRKRPLHTTTTFRRTDAPPFGLLNKYSWHLVNPMHVKHIFDTCLVQLELTRSFVENQDGTYDVYVPKDVDSPPPTAGQGPTTYLPVLKPFELKTYLKIGTMRGDTTPTPFVIEWIPDVLSTSKFGELILQFQFGHDRQSASERNNTKRTVHSSLAPTRESAPYKRLKKTRARDPFASDAKDLHNLRLDYSVAPLNDSEFQELTKSVP